jgi:hypothetical protein
MNSACRLREALLDDSPYDPIEHLAKTFLPTPGWRECLMAMFTAVFDAGGHEADQPCLSVAGFISTADEWTKFSTEWKTRLGKLPFFHATQHKRRRDVLPGLIDLIDSTAFAKFGTAIRFDAFDLLPNTPDSILQNRRMNAYALCGTTCVEKAYRWADANRVPRERIEFVFEEGDIGKGLIIDLMTASHYPTPAFRYKKDTYTRKSGITHPGFVPLQAADLLAHTLFEETRDGRVSPVKLPYPQLENKPGPVGVISKDDVVQYVAYLRDTQHLGPPEFIL